ncbi:coniferyl aldehyde dehydrogenase [Ramlibacter tataouinensis]|uniref:coniferyl aldehyde dehydrogenase n=1 Tax=Ramlibacter tataouinensis TaxID=94132 RepID=UPI0022F3AAE2|nr:coniferyl aldehyde dehydrogenase [Ramlibacter tataouinensis]WBY02286.1 coniferyl aldehyde dehydrogenase [Ramlibacter tataouinensis]
MTDRPAGLGAAEAQALSSSFERLRAAFAADPYPEWPARADRLRRLLRLVREHEPAIAAAIHQDFGGRPAIETEIVEIWPSLDEIKGALRHGRGWMKPRRAGVGKWFRPARARIVPQPVGVVGIIVPWNYPLNLAVVPLAAALAAGNRAMVKLSEFTPAYAALMQRLLGDAFGPDEVVVVTGGAEVAAQFSALPFDHLLFTGSTPVGRKVMAAAAPNLTPVTLELGGKSPGVVTPGYPMAHAAERILMGKLINAGQTCIAPDYVLVHRPELEAFVQAAQQQALRMYPQGLADSNYCSIVNDRQYARLLAGVEEAQGRGSRGVPLFGGEQRSDAGHRLAPLLLLDPPADTRVMNEEIFGPVLPVVPYDTIEQAMRFVQERPRPLALYWFDRERARTEVAMRELPAGGMTVNDTLLHAGQESLPFGGTGASGMGHYHGRWGFETFSKLKPVFLQSRVNALSLFLPPYSPLARRLLHWMKRL